MSTEKIITKEIHAYVRQRAEQDSRAQQDRVEDIPSRIARYEGVMYLLTNVYVSTVISEVYLKLSSGEGYPYGVELIKEKWSKRGGAKRDLTTYFMLGQRSTLSAGYLDFLKRIGLGNITPATAITHIGDVTNYLELFTTDVNNAYDYVATVVKQVVDRELSQRTAPTSADIPLVNYVDGIFITKIYPLLVDNNLSGLISNKKAEEIIHSVVKNQLPSKSTGISDQLAREVSLHSDYELRMARISHGLQLRESYYAQHGNKPTRQYMKIDRLGGIPYLLVKRNTPKDSHVYIVTPYSIYNSSVDKYLLQHKSGDSLSDMNRVLFKWISDKQDREDLYNVLKYRQLNVKLPELPKN